MPVIYVYLLPHREHHQFTCFYIVLPNSAPQPGHPWFPSLFYVRFPYMLYQFLNTLAPLEYYIVNCKCSKIFSFFSGTSFGIQHAIARALIDVTYQNLRCSPLLMVLYIIVCKILITTVPARNINPCWLPLFIPLPAPGYSRSTTTRKMCTLGSAASHIACVLWRIR